jgi:hypothetical protein
MGNLINQNRVWIFLNSGIEVLNNFNNPENIFYVGRAERAW